MANWKFNRQHAIKVVLGEESPSFRFERESYAAIFVVFAFWPGDQRRIVTAARSVGRLILLGDHAQPSNEQLPFLNNLSSFRARGADPWLSNFYERYAVPLGGLSALFEARSIRWIDLQIRRLLEESSVRVCDDLVRFLISMSQYRKTEATRSKAIECISKNIFGVSDHYGAAIEGKRREKYEREHAVVERAIGTKKVEKDWDDSPATTVLRYAVQQTFLAGRRALLGRSASSMLTTFFLHPEEMANALRLYECIMRQLEALPATNAFARWRLLTIEATPDVTALPKFSPEDLQRLQRIRAQ